MNRERAHGCGACSTPRDIVVVGEAADGDDAMQKVLALRPELVFLDVRMPGPDGTQVASRLRDYLPDSVRPLVVFTTAYAEHAVEAFGLESLDYLLKPIERDRLADCLRRVRQRLWSSGRLSVGPAVAGPPPPEAVLTGHRGGSIHAIAVGSVVRVMVEDGLAFAYCVDGARHRLGESLSEVEAELPSDTFMRVSRSAIVSVARIDSLSPGESGTWTARMEDGAEVAVSRRRAKGLRDRVGVSDR